MNESGRGAIGEADPVDLSNRGRKAREEGDFGGALGLLLEAAHAYRAAGDTKAARASAEEALALWPSFEESKALLIEPPRPREPSPGAFMRKRGPPKAREPAPAPAQPVTVLPSLFIEMHAEALALAGRDREARARFDEALSAVQAEVARRRASQEWGEAFSAGLTLVRLAAQANEPRRVEEARREFVALARESARESLTAEYLARGRDEVPLGAIEWALKEAHNLGDAALLAQVKADERQVVERAADLLEELTDEHTAAEAILSWEDTWSFIDSRPAIKRALVDQPELARSLGGPLSSLAGLAESHPARVELREFADRLESAVARARDRAPRLREKLRQLGAV